MAVLVNISLAISVLLSLPKYSHLKDILLDKPKTDIVEALDLREACIAMLNDHRSKLKVNTQLNLLAK